MAHGFSHLQRTVALRKDMHTPVISFQVTVSVRRKIKLIKKGGKLLIYGGCGPNGVFLDQSISTLDLATMSWNTFQPNGGSCPAARAYHCSVLINRDLYVFGGRSGNTYFNDMYCLHLETMSWERITAFGQTPSPRSGCASSVLYSVKKEPFIIIIGGMDGTKCFNDVYVLINHF